MMATIGLLALLVIRAAFEWALAPFFAVALITHISVIYDYGFMNPTSLSVGLEFYHSLALMLFVIMSNVSNCNQLSYTLKGW